MLLRRFFSNSAIRNMRIVPILVREDNYAYLLIDEASKQAAAVDPYDVSKVVAAAEKLGKNWEFWIRNSYSNSNTRSLQVFSS